ncbi:MAG: protein kinase [Ktedonobacteraceae bacterium]|nr:protein kinase [Ktedonobacteraceae bacterium]
MIDRVGQQLGNYRMVSLLGKGGFAHVYLAEHVYLNSQAAVKVLHPTVSDDEREAFQWEAQCLLGLRHSHIVRVFDYALQDNIPFLVMEYAPYGTIRKRHPKGSCVPLATIICYVKQVADALQYLHQQKLIHRDVKPENMLLAAKQDILLSDFGIVAMSQSATFRGQGQVGTPSYMAPEQLLGKPQAASDQYALGVVVYEWLCGERPFSGSTWSIIEQHVQALPPALRMHLPTISPIVESVVLTALAKDPGQRFASVQAFATALEQAHQQEQQPNFVPPLQQFSSPMPPQPGQPFAAPSVVLVPKSSPFFAQTAPLAGFSEPRGTMESLRQTGETLPADLTTQPQEIAAAPQPTPRRTPRRAIALGLALTGFGLLAGLTLAEKGGISGGLISQPPPSLHPGTLATKASLTSKPNILRMGTALSSYGGHSGGVPALAWSPDGKYIASAGMHDGTVQISDAATGAHIYTYSGHFGSVLTVAWSPDGKWIVSGGNDQTAQVWQWQGRQRLSTHKHAGPVFTVTWSPDSQWIASAAGSDHGVQVWQATSGKTQFTYDAHSSWVNIVAYSPDGALIASGSHDTTVQVYTANDGDAIYTYRGHTTPVASLAWSPDSKRIVSGDEQSVQAWDATNGSNRHAYSSNFNGVGGLAWSPTGQCIAAGSLTGQTVQLWDVSDGSPLYTQHWDGTRVCAVAWSPDGQRLAQVGMGPVLVWWAAK